MSKPTSIFHTGLVREGKYPFQKIFYGKPLPLVVENAVPGLSIEKFTQTLSDHMDEIEQLMHDHGAVLFRGFPTPTANEFSLFIKALKNWVDLPYEESLSYAVRKPICDRVCTTNEGSSGMIWHHEQAQAPYFPSKVAFFCEKPADEGGATGITHSIHVLDKIREKYPDWVRMLEEKKVVYKTTIPAEVDLSASRIGRPWRDYFGRPTKEGTEKRAKELGYTVQWLPDDSLFAITPPLPGVRECPGTGGKRSFMNQMIVQLLGNRKEWIRLGNPPEKFDFQQYMTFADGTVMATEPLEYAAAVSDEAAVDLPWQKGDICVIDNFVLMHVRRAFSGDRKVYASLSF